MHAVVVSSETSPRCTALVAKQTNPATYAFLSTGLQTGPDLTIMGPAQSIPMHLNVALRFKWAAGSWPNTCGLGLAVTFLHVTQLRTTDLMARLLLKIQNLLDGDADTRVTPACSIRRCSDLINNSMNA